MDFAAPSLKDAVHQLDDTLSPFISVVRDFISLHFTNVAKQLRWYLSRHNFGRLPMINIQKFSKGIDIGSDGLDVWSQPLLDEEVAALPIRARGIDADDPNFRRVQVRRRHTQLRR